MSNPLKDMEKPDVIFCIGTNMTECHPVAATRLKKAIAKGAKMIVADPREIGLSKLADINLQLRVGSDSALLLGMAHVIHREGLVDEGFMLDRTTEAEEFLKHIFTYVLDHCQEDMGFFNQYFDKTAISTLEGIVTSDFERLTYTEAVDILQRSGKSFEFPVVWGSDLQSEHERYLAETKIGKPIIVTDYPKEIKAFYMRLNEDGKTARALDVLVPRIGEIIGGSQREERRDVLLERIRQSGLDEKNYWWYLDLRSYGTVPHAGFGLGFERTVQFVTGVANIRDVIPFPRTPNNAEF